MIRGVPKIGRLPSQPASRDGPVQIMAGNREHVITLQLGPIEKGGAVGRREIGRKEAVADMEAPSEQVPSSLEAEPDRVHFIPADHSRNVSGNTFKTPFP